MTAFTSDQDSIRFVFVFARVCLSIPRLDLCRSSLHKGHADRFCIGVSKSSILSFRSLSAWVRGPGAWKGILGHIVVVAIVHRRSKMSYSYIYIYTNARTDVCKASLHPC